MARGIEGNEISTPKPTLKKSSSSSKPDTKQRSIASFFQKVPNSKPLAAPSSSSQHASTPLTPAASSEAVSSPISAQTFVERGKNKENHLPSPFTPTQEEIKPTDASREDVDGKLVSSPSHKVKFTRFEYTLVIATKLVQTKKTVNYAESDSEDEVLQPVQTKDNSKRLSKRKRVALEDSEDEFELDDVVDDAKDDAMDDEDLDDFIVPDDSEDEVVRPPKRKKPSPRSSNKPSPTPPKPVSSDDEGDFTMPAESTACQWTFDPENPGRINPNQQRAPKKSDSSMPKKQKPHTTEPEKRYPWLANILDADRNPPGHPDYDPRTLYIPPMAFDKFSAFEKQYWEIKQKLWDTIMFFKKGKFYELYENDATVGHQLFDLKLTDRVNMRMVGVPESSLDYWAAQFVAKGFKIARVDQMESALAKEMRERDEEPVKRASSVKKEVIRRELASVLTSGTLVEPGMLQDDMSTYCVAVKEIERDNHPAFGIAFVDTATAQFFMTEFDDDTDMTKFETLVAQTRPGELLLEKSCISAKALRILKNNTSPTTIWNYLKPGKEFWPADITSREIDASGYFVSLDSDNIEAWPTVLREAREKELVMSALGALIQYLRMLKIERDLVTLGNFTWYDPIRKASSLVLDGQTLINLEIFANTFDGGSEGTLFAMLNRCITPFGKRMLRQWVCHPLADARKINARLDAVDVLMADRTLSDQFSASLSKIPDLERLISRVHAGRCKGQDFVRVLDGFEQIEYTISLLGEFAGEENLIGQLISSMPDLDTSLKQWKDAFDRKLAKQDGILVPQRGVEEDFDESQDRIDQCERDLNEHLKEARRKLGSSSIEYKDSGKEIYQLEVPAKIKKELIPKSWDQMSATKAVKRYYNPELRKLVRSLQEAQETHSQIVKEVAGRFYARFDEDYSIWLAAIKIVAQLDCLISLAKASQALGQPSCRPTFVDDERTVIEFEELRHPCMLTSVDNFIPNDIKLGGSQPNIDLLTGANAAGKSTVLRMTCIAVILAQIGCHLPCVSATLTPIDRIMSRLGAHDNIFAAQSTFFVELSETKKILSEATPRSLVILDELGRGTSSYDGVAVAQAVLHEVATRIGCVGFFATHYRSLAEEFSAHPEIRCARMAIDVDDDERRVTFLYRLEPGVAEGSFGMHCAAMCGIPRRVVERAEAAAKEWEHTSRLKESLERAREGCYIPLGVQSDVAWMMKDGMEDSVEERALEVLRRAVEAL